MKKILIIAILSVAAISSYMVFDIYRYKDVREDFIMGNPGCNVISVQPLGESKKKHSFLIHYKREGDDSVYEMRWFFQENTDGGNWDKLQKDTMSPSGYE